MLHQSEFSLLEGLGQSILRWRRGRVGQLRTVMGSLAVGALILHNNNKMLPYKPVVSISKPYLDRIKPIPSIEFTGLLLRLCENSANSYDRKNHVLIIKDMQQFENALFFKSMRSFKSFEKQLRILGFKSRRANSEDSLPERVYVYKWRGKKEELVNKELELIDSNLKERRKIVEAAKEQIREKREAIDQQIERIIFSLMVDRQLALEGDRVNSVVSATRNLVNSTEVDLRAIVNQISSTMGHELELYRLLIYKEGEQYKPQEDEQAPNQDTSEHQQEENSEKSAAISIKMEAQQEHSELMQ